MLFLPDVRIRENTLSLQDPFLLNGYIIVDIAIDSTMNYMSTAYQSVTLKNENNYCVQLDMAGLEYCFREKMDEFLARYGNYAHVEGRRDITDWHRYSLNSYLEDLNNQCRNIQQYQMRAYGENHYLNCLKRDLRRQNREFFEPSSLSSFSNELSEYYRNWLRPSCGIDANQLRVNMEAIASWTYSGHIVHTSKGEYIHAYNYKPNYIKYYMPDEDKDATLLLGAEIEVDGGGESEEHAEKVLEIICGVDLDDSNKVLEDKMYCMHDGSLTKGLEFATMPCSLEYHKKEMRYKDMFEYLDNNGYKAHDTTTCGLHIHANRTYLGKTELMQQLTISKILYIIEKFNDEICVIARRDNKYSQFVGAGKNETSIVELYGKYKNQDKYVALNLKHPDTIEFRCFKGTLKYETYILTLEFVKNIIDYAKSINIEEIELIKWSDLMNTFSDELKAYYNTRLDKELLKTEKFKIDKITDVRCSINGETYTVPVANLAINANNTSYNAAVTMNPNALRDFMLGGVVPASINLGDCSSYVSIPLREHTVEKTELEILKDKEKTLKKKIKYSNNPLEKKNLDKELKEVQKEIKKEKGRRKKRSE